MTPQRMQTLFDLAEEFYAEELAKSGMSTIPWCWARDHRNGKLLIFSHFGMHSVRLAKTLDIPWRDQTPEIESGPSPLPDPTWTGRSL